MFEMLLFFRIITLSNMRPSRKRRGISGEAGENVERKKQ